MVDDEVRMLNSKFPPDERESAITIIEHSGKMAYSYCI
jgi:negative elongation factor B